MPDAPRMSLGGKSRLGLVRPDRIGDCVLASAAIRDVLAAHPRTEVFWIVRDTIAPLFAGRDFPATLVSFRDDEAEPALAARFRALRLDAVAHLDPHPLTEAAMRLAGVPLRAGVKSSGHPLNLTVAAGFDKNAGLLHEAEYGRKVVNLLRDFAVDESPAAEPCVAPAEAALSEAVSIIPGHLRDDGTAARRFAVFHPGAHGDKTRLPARLFAEVAAHLATRHRLPVILIGASPGKADLDAAALPDCVDLRGRLSLAASAHLARAAALVLSRDSGPAHLAAALGAPTVCVFLENAPAMSPRRWAPLGPRVEIIRTPATPRWYEKLNHDWYRARAARAVRTGEVLAACDRLLADTRDAARL